LGTAEPDGKSNGRAVKTAMACSTSKKKNTEEKRSILICTKKFNTL